MDGDVLMFAQVMTVVVMSTASFVAIGLGTRVLWRMGSRTRPVALPAPAAGDDRLARLENAVESIAIEVERISEGQRFTVALLSERLPRADRVDALTAGPKRVITPH
jgi:hypothetical protein